MKKETSLCVVTGNLIVPEECFVDGGAEKMLSLLRLKLKEFVPDPTTPEGLEEIRSFAAKFPKSKTAFDKAGKEFKEQYKIKIIPIDRERKIFRDECDKMRDEARLPLTLHEEKQKKLEEAERQKIAMELDWDEALQIDDLFNREREIARKEAEQARIEEEKRQNEQAEIDRKAQLDYEEKVRKEAEEKAVKDYEESLLKEQQEKERLIAEAKQREEQAKIDAELAEKKRLADIQAEKERAENARIEAEKKAEREKQEAIAEQQMIQNEKERVERERIAAEKAEEERKAKNRNHQKAVNNRVLKKIMDCGISDNNAKALIEDILKNPVPEISINY